MTVAQVNVKIANAQTAYDDLMTGNKANVIIDQNGEQVRYTPATATSLYTYLQQLQAALFNLTAAPCDKVSGPIGFLF
jgi:hypothetical protein